MTTDSYSLNIDELISFYKSSDKLKTTLNFLIWYGQIRLHNNMNQWKNIDNKPSYNAQTPPYSYEEKNHYVNAPNSLWSETMWSFNPRISEIYYQSLLRTTKGFENREKYNFNKGIIYGNLGVVQSAQMKIDEGFANILNALIEDVGFSTGPSSPKYDVFKRDLFEQFEVGYVRKPLENIVSKLGITGTSPFEKFVIDFLNSISTDQRIFFDYMFARIMQNLEIWKEKENSFTANRILAYSQDFCLFNEDFLKSKTPAATLLTKPHWELKKLIKAAFPTVNVDNCSADSMPILDGKLVSDLANTNQIEKCLRVLLTLRNYSSHNVTGGTSANVFYNRYFEVLSELARALVYIKLLP